MRHHNKNRTLGRVKNQRTALMRSLAASLILEEGVETTVAKAKEVRPFIEKLVTIAKKDTVTSRRLVSERLGGARGGASTKLFSEIAPRYKARTGGYVRIVRTRVRSGDAATMARIMFV